MENLVSIIKLAGGFGLVIAFGVWQIRSLNKLDQEDEERRSKQKND